MTIQTDQPQWVSQTLQQGFTALMKGDFQTAGECCRKVLSANPKLVQGHFLVGLIATELKDNRTAIGAFGSVTKLEPSHAAAWAQLARLFISLGQVNRADKALDEAVRHNHNDPIVEDLVGTVYQLLGDQHSSLDWYTRALSKSPENIQYLINHANALVYLGRTEDATADLEQALKLQPFNPQAHWILASTRKAKTTSHIDAMQKIADSPQLQHAGSAFIHYAIGKEYEDLENWQQAFTAFANGAAARRQALKYDESLEIAMFSELERLFTVAWLDDDTDQNQGLEDDSPIFVLGQPRTGTTLIERIITSHSQVQSAGELQQFGLAVRRLGNYQEAQRFSPKLFTQAVGISMPELGEAYMRSSEKMRGRLPRFVDKLPSNYLYLPLILKALPNAKIIHLTRNPMDACFASFKQLFADAYPHSYDQVEMARHHARYLQLMQTWRQRFPGRFLDVSYEETTLDLETNARRIIQHLQLPWEDACLHFHQQQGAVATASAVQVREPVHTRSINRWKKYERQLQPMLNALLVAGVDLPA